MKKILSILCSMLFLITGSLVFAQNITIEDAVETALHNNDKIKQYGARLKQKGYEYDKSLGNFLPAIDFSWRYTHLNDKLEIDLNPIREAIIQLQSGNQVEFANIYNMLQNQTPLPDAQKAALFAQFQTGLNQLIPPFVETLKKQDYKTAGFSGIQPIFLGGKLFAAKNFASAEEDAANYEFQKIKNEIIAETVQNYLRVLLLQKVVETRKDVMSGISKHKERAEKLYQKGLIANYHVLRAKVALSEAERKLHDDQNNLELSMIALMHTIAVEDTAGINLSDSLSFADYSAELNDFSKIARINQPILKMIDAKLDGAEQKYAASRANFLPQVAAFGRYDIYPEYLSALEPRWAVGVQVSLNIFNGFKDYNDIQTSVFLENEVKFIRADAVRKIDLLIRKSFKDYENAKSNYLKLESDILLAKENLRMNEKRFETGLGTSLEVIDARLSLEKAEIDRQVYLHNYYSALTDLHLAAGEPQKVIKILKKEL